MLTEKEIKSLIAQDKADTRKKRARVGAKYYDGKHDINESRVIYFQDGKPYEDRAKTNAQISHPFFTELVDQEVQYLLSSDARYITSDNEELDKALELYFNEDFTAELTDTLTDSVSRGFGYMYAFKDVDGRTHFVNADSMGVIEVSPRETTDKCEYVVYYYTDSIKRNNKVVERVQVWDKSQVYYYTLIGGKLEADEDAELNPRPHILYRDTDSDELYGEDLGYIPFFRLDNNKARTSQLEPIKAIIDDYDLMSCGLTNNIQDHAEAYWVVKGFEGDNLDELVHNIRNKKQVGVDSDGDVDIKTVAIPYEARKAKLEIDEANIYRFGMGFNSTQLGDGNITNVVIKSRYALLDLKVNKLEKQLKKFLRQLINVVLNEINELNGTGYTVADTSIYFEREVMANALDNAQIDKTIADTQAVQINNLLNSADYLDHDEIIRQICKVLELDYSEARKVDELLQAQQLLDSMELGA